MTEEAKVWPKYWKNKLIKELTDAELLDASVTLAEMFLLREERIKQRKERHQNINLDSVSETFLTLQAEVKQEMSNRKLMV